MKKLILVLVLLLTSCGMSVEFTDASFYRYSEPFRYSYPYYYYPHIYYYPYYRNIYYRNPYRPIPHYSPLPKKGPRR